MAWGYPDIDTCKVLKLASTKGYIQEYVANIFGTSGYCIPVSSKYVKYGAEEPEELSILTSALKTDETSIIRVINSILYHPRPKKIGILGMSYLGDIKVHILSGALRFIKNWHPIEKTKTVIKVHDPLYTEKEIKKISGKETFDLRDLNKFDAIIVTSNHQQYKKMNKKALVRLTKNCKFILDNCGIWEDVKFKCPYIVPGRKDWLKTLRRSV